MEKQQVPDVSITQSFAEGVRSYRNFFWYAFLVYFAYAALNKLFAATMSRMNHSAALFLSFVLVFVNFHFFMGVLALFLDMARQGTVNWSRLLAGFRRYGRVWGLVLLFGLAFLPGTVFLAILLPSPVSPMTTRFLVLIVLVITLTVVLLARTLFSYFVLIDEKHLGAIGSIKRSIRITRGNWSTIVLFGFVQCLIALVPACTIVTPGLLLGSFSGPTEAMQHWLFSVPGLFIGPWVLLSTSHLYLNLRRATQYERGGGPGIDTDVVSATQPDSP